YSALAMCVLAERAGVPDGVVSVVTGAARPIGEELTSHPFVRKLSFTGSIAVGKLLMAQCAPTVKKLSLELGGNAPFIVFDDADLETAVRGAVASKYRNAGQTCVCANRIYVQSGIYDRVADRTHAELHGLDGCRQAAHGAMCTYGEEALARARRKCAIHRVRRCRSRDGRARRSRVEVSQCRPDVRVRQQDLRAKRYLRSIRRAFGRNRCGDEGRQWFGARRADGATDRRARDRKGRATRKRCPVARSAHTDRRSTSFRTWDVFHTHRTH